MAVVVVVKGRPVSMLSLALPFGRTLRSCGPAALCWSASRSAASKTTSSIGMARNMRVDFNGLRKYLKVHGHLIVPQTFQFSPEDVDDSIISPNLGKHVLHLRTAMREKQGTIRTQDYEKLMRMGFVLYPVNEKFKKLVRALQTYEKIHGHYMVPVKFVVPKDNMEWPRELWGIPLGDRYKRLLLPGGMSDEERKYIVDQDVSTKQIMVQKAERLVMAVRTYKEVHCIPEGSRCFIPSRHTIPTDSKEWPRQLWGMKLGMMVKNAINGKQYPTCREELAALGVAVSAEDHHKDNGNSGSDPDDTAQ